MLRPRSPSCGSTSGGQVNRPSCSKLLEAVAVERHLDTKAKTWPKDARWLRRRLNEVEPALLALGVRIGQGWSGHEREISLERTGGNDVGVVGDDGTSS